MLHSRRNYCEGEENMFVEEYQREYQVLVCWCMNRDDRNFSIAKERSSEWDVF